MPPGLIKGSYHAGGYLYFAWVIPGAGFTLLVFLRSLGLLRILPVATRRGMLTAGAIYLAGAIGLESVGANYTAHAGQVQDLTFQLLCTFEEGLEVLGLWWFLRTLLPFSADPAAAAPPEERAWGRVALDLGRAAAIGAAITGAGVLIGPQLVRLDPLKGKPGDRGRTGQRRARGSPGSSSGPAPPRSAGPRSRADRRSR